MRTPIGEIQRTGSTFHTTHDGVSASLNVLRNGAGKGPKRGERGSSTTIDGSVPTNTCSHLPLSGCNVRLRTDLDCDLMT